MVVVEEVNHKEKGLKKFCRAKTSFPLREQLNAVKRHVNPWPPPTDYLQGQNLLASFHPSYLECLPPAYVYFKSTR